jgi:hypothetical protein
MPDEKVVRRRRGGKAALPRGVIAALWHGRHVAGMNAYSVLFDPRLARPFIRNWERVAHNLLAALHLESLREPHDEELGDLLRSLHAYPDVPEAWRQPDPRRPADATFTVVFERGDLRLAFLTTVTRFNAPTNVTLEELRIESYFPSDEATEAACRALSG